MSAWTPSAGDETGNSEPRRRASGWYDKYFRADQTVLDVGAGKRPVVEHARAWDIARGDGDAAALRGIDAESYDTVYASHVLEHMVDPVAALAEWWRVVKPGGHLIVAVPHCGLYEHRVWPSLFNADHKSTWNTLTGPGVDDGDNVPETHYALGGLVAALPMAELVELALRDERYDYSLADRPVDQPTAERQVEAVVRKVASPEWRSSLVGTLRCSCGYDRCTVEGIGLGNRLLISCPACGQGSAFGLGQGGPR